MNLLIVDDERITREGLTNSIDWSKLGIKEIKTACNGFQALEICNSFQPDILLCDIKMPKMDGISFCKHLRDINNTCEIIFLSGYPEKENLQQALHIHALDFFEKPLSMDKIISAVQAAISRRKEHVFIHCNEDEDEYDSKINKIEQYIKQHLYMKELTVKMIADKFYLNSNYFCTMFKQKVGQTPIEYITSQRIEKAKKLLKDHSLKLYEIASMVGISNAEYFTLLFKKCTGFTPSQYRDEGDQKI